LIPRVIHFVWIGSPLPDWAERNLEEFRRLNRGYEVKVHNESAILPELAEVMAGAKHPSSKADLVRLSALWNEGGWYFDVDYWPLRALREAEGAWGLDGRRVFVSKQNVPDVPINNCVIASGRAAAGLRELIDTAKITKSESRCSYGPDLFSTVVGRKPSLFTVCDWPWFQPMRHTGAADYYQRALRGNVQPLRDVCPKTGGQLPYALHLWLNGRGAELVKAFQTAPDDKPFAYVEDCEDKHPISGIVAGLKAMGVAVRRYRRDDELVLDRSPQKPVVLVAWNNVRRAKLAESAARNRVPALWCENGFFDRKRYMQADPEGFLHRASWRRLLGNPAPADGAAKLARFYPNGITPMAPRTGYILVLGQVPNDTQMADSEIQGPVPLQKEIIRVLPKGQACFFRPHPALAAKKPNPQHQSLPVMDTTQDERRDYQDTKTGPGLGSALGGARFVITINSNAGVDALAAGVPVLAFGPHLGIDAGAIRRATVATLAADIDAMLRGWQPEQSRVENFMRWLAARQWCREEFSGAATMRALLAEAGVDLSGGGERPGSLPGPGAPVAACAPEGLEV